MITIDEAAKKKEFSSIPNTLVELSHVLKSNQKQMKRVQAENKWTLPLSVIGIILTIIFGIFGNYSLSNTDLEKISRDQKEIIINTLDSIDKNNVDSTICHTK